MPGRLRFDNIDVTERATVELLLDTLANLARDPDNRYTLEVRKRYYFAVPDGPITTDAGWYVICGGANPLYVGTGENLNARLNSENGSRDQFANPKRKSDPERNFIKAFVDASVLKALIVIVIPEPAICSAVGVTSPLTRLDRHNVEKILNLFRDVIVRGES